MLEPSIRKQLRLAELINDAGDTDQPIGHRLTAIKYSAHDVSACLGRQVVYSSYTHWGRDQLLLLLLKTKFILYHRSLLFRTSHYLGQHSFMSV